jgi:hypothetical protein
MQSAVNGLDYICRGLQRHPMPAAELASSMVIFTELSQKCIKQIVRGHTQHQVRKDPQPPLLMFDRPCMRPPPPPSPLPLPQAAITALAADPDSSSAARTLNIGRLISLDWKLGVSLTSSHCANLKTPFVSIIVRVAEQDGEVATHALELSLPEFQDFKTTLRAAGSSLDRF